jgi:hypothetical protein
MYRVEAEDGRVVRTYANIDADTVQTSSEYVYNIDSTDEYQQLLTKPTLSINVDSEQLINDGNDTVLASVTVQGVREFDTDSFDITVVVNGKTFAGTISESDEYTEKITTTANAGTAIELKAIGTAVRSSNVVEIEVVES